MKPSEASLEAREPLLSPLAAELATSRRWYICKRVALFLGLAVLVAARMAVMFAAHRGHPIFPYCRKSALIAVLPTAEGSGSSTLGNSSTNEHLVVWAGQGLHKAIRSDLAAFDLRNNTWLGPLRPDGELGVDTPLPRWKAGNAQVAAGGMVIAGGDAYWPGTQKHRYGLFDSIWHLGYPSLRWTKANPRLHDSDMPVPPARRGHSTITYKGEDGWDHIVVFGGRTRGKRLLNDCWEVTLRWHNATLGAEWRMVSPQDSPSAPGPRRGHSALLLGNGTRPLMLVYGGREEMHYYGDHIWLLDIRAGRWSRIEPAGDMPSMRDHHSVALHRGKMYVFGGRSGKDYCHSAALNDLWSLELESWRWEKVEASGPLPLPRFEQSYAQWGSRLLVFGGQVETQQQSRHVCQLNDIWQLDLETLEWSELSAPRFCTCACCRRYSGGAHRSGGWWTAA